MKDYVEEEKECSMCNEVKPINTGRSFTDGFHKRAESEDGYRHQCKDCYNGTRYETQRVRRESGPFRLKPVDDIGVSPDLLPEIKRNSQIKDNVIIQDSKVCKRCKERKPFEEFHRHKTSKFGCHPVCKVCRLEEAYQKKLKRLEEEDEGDDDE